MQVFYKIISKGYDLLDVVYFRDFKKSPSIITEWEPSKQLSRRILFAPIHYLEPKTYRKFIKTDLYSYFEKYGLSVQEDIHCDYTRVITLKKI